MRKFIFVLMLSAGMCSAASGGLTVRFLGNAAFEITDGDSTLLTDFPYESGAFGYMKYRMSDVHPKGNVACLITHRHKDHFDLALLEGTNWRVIGPREVLEALPEERRLRLEDRTQFGAAVIIPIRSDHAGTEHYSYLIEWQGKRLYFSGDTESTSELLSQKKLDVAFITPWLLQSLKGTMPDARTVVIQHHMEDEKVELCSRCVLPASGQLIGAE